MPPAGCEPAIPANKRLKIHSVDHAVTGIGLKNKHVGKYQNVFHNKLSFFGNFVLIIRGC
jgi:hypothetical protein